MTGQAGSDHAVMTSSLPSAQERRRRLGPVRVVAVVLAWTLYVTAFWGNFQPPWPVWVRQYAGWAFRAIWRVYEAKVAVPAADRMTHYLSVWLAVGFVFAAIVPVAGMRLAGRRWRDIGLGASNGWGWRVVLLCLVVALPFAYGIAPEQKALLTSGPWIRIAAPAIVTLPEHILITGICVATLLPGMRFPRPAPLAPVEGAAGMRLLRWLGLAQPMPSGASRGRRALAWLGLTPATATAVAGGGLLFGVVHVGAGPVEFMTSFPGGVAVCYVTLRCGSIWPAWVVHIGEMALVLAFVLAGR
ncbi:MAG: CPBP family intramembrane metalloprotease [Phycisphaerae bacterium]|nr:CPBP family intramembrane metalloprotease [Phycisphaerae bacterium]